MNACEEWAQWLAMNPAIARGVETLVLIVIWCVIVTVLAITFMFLVYLYTQLHQTLMVAVDKVKFDRFFREWHTRKDRNEN